MSNFVLCLTLCHSVLVFFSPFSIAITLLGEERANFSAFRTFVRFVLIWICRFPLPLGVWEGLRFVIVALPGLFSYLFLVVCAHSGIKVPEANEFVCPGCCRNHRIQIIIELVINLIWVGHCGCIGTYNWCMPLVR